MGEYSIAQPLTTGDKITVILYRSGIVFTALLFILSSAVLVLLQEETFTIPHLFHSITLILLYLSVGLSVFFIHLYVGKFYRFLKKIFYTALFGLLVLTILGGGSPAFPFFSNNLYMLLLLPLSGCLGFVTAKEAFCFRLREGYLILFTLPLYIIFFSFHLFSLQGAIIGILAITFLITLFTLRKVFMPLHSDIGDKSAYIQ